MTPDNYLPSSKLFSTNCGSPRRDEPRAEACGEALIGGDQGTPEIGNVCAPAVAKQNATWHLLTPTELRVLHVLCEGVCDKVIANRLDMKLHTVKSHIRHLRTKLGVNSRLAVVVTALRRGLLKLEDIAC